MNRQVKVTLKDNIVSIVLTKEMNKKAMKKGKAKGSLDIHSYSIEEAEELNNQLGIILSVKHLKDDINKDLLAEGKQCS